MGKAQVFSRYFRKRFSFELSGKRFSFRIVGKRFSFEIIEAFPEISLDSFPSLG
jgi:hypothetical protein